MNKPKSHPLARHTGMDHGADGRLEPQKSKVRAATGGTTWSQDAAGNVCRETKQKGWHQTTCKSVQEWNLENAAGRTQKEVARQYQADLGNRLYTEEGDYRRWENYNKDECGTINKLSGGDYTWWAQNGYDVDTTVYATQTSQGMSKTPIKVPKGKGADKVGPAAYTLNYNWNDVTNKCDRKLTLTPWLRDAINCKGNLGENCDLGFTVMQDLEKWKSTYYKEKGNTNNQAYLDFITVANEGITQAIQNKQNCTYNSWWDRQMCAGDQLVDGFLESVGDTASAFNGLLKGIGDNMGLIVIGIVIVVAMS